MTVPDPLRPTQELIHEFHKAFNCRINEPPTPELIRERRGLIVEEVCELLDELDAAERGAHNRALIAKELADAVYVLYGAAVNLGIDLDAAVGIVHVSNMSKLGSDGRPVFRESDGKVLKPPGYIAPDMRSTLLKTTKEAPTS